MTDRSVGDGGLLAGAPDAGAFLGRLTRLDPQAVVRLRPAGPDLVALWARLPFGPLVTRQVPGRVAGDATVRAADLLDLVGTGAGELPERRDRAWRWPLPPAPARLVERVPAGELRRIGQAAAQTLRTATAGGVRGRPVGSRMLRDALLDHVPLVVTDAGGRRFEVTQRLVQAVLRMGFLPSPQVAPGAEPDGPDAATVGVQEAAGWVGLAATFGTAWQPPAGGLSLHPVRRAR